MKNDSAWGFDVKTRDMSVRAQDDFYRHSNGGWLKKNKIPATEARWGSFTILRYEVEQQLHALVEEQVAKKNAKKGSPEQLIGDFYRSGMDIAKRNELGTTPLAPYFNKIEKVSTQTELLDLIAEFHVYGITALWGTDIDQDMNNSDKYLLHIVQDGIGLPDRDYYLKNDTESVRVREEYKKHMARMFKLLGDSDAEKKVETVMAIELKLAKASMDKAVMRDVDKTFNKMTPAQIKKLAPQIDWARYLKLTDADGAKHIVVTQPEFIKACGKLIESVPLDDWKTYLTWHLITDCGSYLSEKFLKELFSFYGPVLSGRKKMRPLWRQVLAVVNGSVSEEMGKLYVARHFPPEAKKKMDALVDDLFAAYEERIKNLDWMTPATKKKALVKLSMIGRKIGYPSKWKSYRGLTIKPDDFFGNGLRASVFEHKHQMKKITGPLDRTEWLMAPQEVNAYCHFNMNEIAFPAAILQFPFFDMNADDAINYGAIGSVIGHEITHALDDQGAKFDGKGNRKNWWSEADLKQFKARGAVVAKQFDQYEVADGVKVNGKLTLGENIADLGGLSIAYDAYMKQLERTGRKDIAGLSPEQRFFLGYSQEERELVTPEFEKVAVLTDPHSPGQYRCNGPLSNMPEFYDAYSVKKGDKLYRDPAKRAKIW